MPPPVAEVQQLVMDVPGGLAGDARVILAGFQAFAALAVARGAREEAPLQRVVFDRGRLGNCGGGEQENRRYEY